jgi:hypothetical protein
MKTLFTTLKLVALLSVSVVVFSGCESSGGGGASVSGGVYYGAGFYDPWMYGAGYYPPTVIVTPPPNPPPRPEHPIARPLPAPAPRPMPSIPSAPRPMARPAGRR